MCRTFIYGCLWCIIGIGIGMGIIGVILHDKIHTNEPECYTRLFEGNGILE